jgi:hypothetical protein
MQYIVTQLETLLTHYLCGRQPGGAPVAIWDVCRFVRAAFCKTHGAPQLSSVKFSGPSGDGLEPHWVRWVLSSFVVLVIQTGALVWPMTVTYTGALLARAATAGLPTWLALSRLARKNQGVCGLQGCGGSGHKRWGIRHVVAAWYINTDRRQALLWLATAMHVRLACHGQTLQVTHVHTLLMFALWLPVSVCPFVHSLRAEACIWRQHACARDRKPVFFCGVMVLIPQASEGRLLPVNTCNTVSCCGSCSCL